MLDASSNTRRDAHAGHRAPFSSEYVDTRCQMVEQQMAAARPRLLRLAMLHGVSADGAEDVVQETLLEAWRSRRALRSPERSAAWLDGICRNVCRRWVRVQGTVAAHYQPLTLTTQGLLVTGDAQVEAELSDPLICDPAEELTKRDLATLLDLALAHLHPSTREGMILRYVADLPVQEVAARLRVSVGVVEVRLHRARKQLREVLRGALRDEAESFGIQLDMADRGGANGPVRRETRVWCPLCGIRHLEAEINWTTSESHYWCPSCGHLAGAGGPELLSGVSSYKPILSRILGRLTTFYTQGLEARKVECGCGRMARVEVQLAEEASEDLHCQPALYIRCTVCGIIDVTNISRLTVDRLETQRFWRAHPRVRLRPAHELETQGEPALLMSVESVTDEARMEIVWARRTLQVLAVYGSQQQ
jgi:RNA polymerase sigma factor (sigma-70 family)